ncbi:hypothetical protein C8F04DRAFT_1152864 [Mycena alexandri]|uniref:Uncharacterized protein n=1 Tax=Mycena alexandri TaxID=1745969 RepID=A0AAD6S0N8_9AGAR|nr:hypothetical protein C8F04DRAFT_1152864 [Mycena alexandri]
MSVILELRALTRSGSDRVRTALWGSCGEGRVKNEILRGELHIGTQYSSALQSFVLATPPSNHIVFHRPWRRRFKLLGPADYLGACTCHCSLVLSLTVCQPLQVWTSADRPHILRGDISDPITMPVRRQSSHVIRHPVRCHSAETMYRLSAERPHRGFFPSSMCFLCSPHPYFRCVGPLFKCPIFPLPLRDGFIQRKGTSLCEFKELLSFRCAVFRRAAGLRVDEFHIDFLRLHLCNEADLHSSATFATRGNRH